jgi:cytochrome c
MKRILIFGLFLTVSACGKPANDAAVPTESGTGPAATVAANAAPASFAQCAVCHQVKPGASGLGPNLHAVVGRKAGTLAGFTYSPAMKASALVWDEATLDRYIEKPQAAVPGTRMAYPGQSDKAKRAEIIAWLKSNS